MKIPYWNRLPIRRQLLFTVNGLLFLVVVSFLLVDHGLRISDARREKKISLAKEAKTVYESVEAIRNRGEESIQQLLNDVCGRMNTTDSPGHHIAVEWMGKPLQATSHGRASNEMLDSMRAENDNDSSQVVAKFEGEHGTVFIAESEESVLRGARSELYRQLVALVFVGTLAGITVNIVLRKIVTKPLNRLVEALGQIGAGNLKIEASERSSEELAFLSDHINLMVKSLASADNDRRLHMNKARKIQQNLRPTQEKIYGIEMAELFEPAEDIGGDYYDVIPLNDDKVMLCLSDVSGHGVPAAMAATVVKALVFEALETTFSPAEILERINRRYTQIIVEGHFATMVAMVVDFREMTLTYCNAGQEYPLIVEPQKDIVQFKSSNLILGIDANWSFQQETISISNGTRIILLSDGVTEILDPEGNQFGIERVKQVIDLSRNGPVSHLVDNISKALEKFRRSQPPFDDTTLLAVDVNV